MAGDRDLLLKVGADVASAVRGIETLAAASTRAGKKSNRAFSLANRALGSFLGNFSSRAAFAGIRALNAGLRNIATNTRAAARGFAEINTLLPENQKLTDSSKDSIREFSAQFGAGIADQTKGFYQIVSAGIEGTANQLKFLEQASKAAVGGLASVNQAADVGTTLFNVFGHSGETVTSIFDKMFVTIKKGKTTFPELAQNIGQVAKFADSAGISLGELTGSLAFLTKNGIKTDIAVRGLRQVFATLAKPSEEATKIAKMLGIQFDTTAVRGGKLAHFLRKVAVATGGSEKILSKLFGNIRALNPILAIARGNFGDFKRIIDEVTNSTGAGEKAFKEMEKNMDFQLKRLKKNFELVGMEIGKNFEGAITKASLKLNKFFSDKAARQGFVRDISNVAITVGRLINTFIITPVEFFGRLFTNLSQMIKNQMKIIGSSFSVFGLHVEKVFTAITSPADLFFDDKLKQFDVKIKKASKTQEALAKKNTKLFGDIFSGDGKIGSSFDKFLDKAAQDAAVNGASIGKSLVDGIKKGGDEAAGDTGILPLKKVDLAAIELQLEVDQMMGVLNGFEMLFLDGINRTTKKGKQQFLSFAKSIQKFTRNIKSSLISGIANGAGQAFASFGKAVAEGENPIKAFAESMLKTMGQMAIQLGTMFIAEGIAMTWAGMANGPALIAAGAALATFGGVMGVISGGGSSSGGGISSGDSGGLTPEFDDSANESQPITQQERSTEIVVNVEGNVVDQDQFFNDMAVGLRDAIQKDGAIVDVRTA